jgi:hypothetical protein
MTAEVRQQMIELCRQIQTEQDQQKFTQLLEKLDLVCRRKIQSNRRLLKRPSTLIGYMAKPTPWINQADHYVGSHAFDFAVEFSRQYPKNSLEM